MENSEKFFCNKWCTYYPCHKGIENLNCLFCFCPLYDRGKCPGNYILTEVNGKTIKDCSNCLFPHKPENYEKIIDIIKS